MRIKTLVPLILVLLLTYSASASVVGVSPSIARFNKMIRGGYAEMSAVASTSFTQDISAGFEKKGEIAPWLRIEPSKESFNFSRNNPYSFTLIIEPPEDTANNNYTGTLLITTQELGSVKEGAGSSVIAQVAMLIYVEVIGQEIVACRAGAISTGNAEINDGFTLRYTVYNDGNVRLRPQVLINVYDQFQTQILYTTSVFGSQILPTRKKSMTQEVENSLSTGQYFAEIYFPECDVTKITTFDILEKGQISDSGMILGIRTNEVANTNELIPIAPMFRNLGQRKVIAQFKGEVRNLKTNKLLTVLESDSLEVLPDETIEFRMFFTATKSGDYQISGRVKYNNKITFDEKSKVINVKGKDFDFSWILYLILYVIIGLIILILIRKIKKVKQRKRRKKIF